MSEELNHLESLRASDRPADKRPWHRPQVQEIDVLDTETGVAAYVADFTTYGS